MRTTSFLLASFLAACGGGASHAEHAGDHQHEHGDEHGHEHGHEHGDEHDHGELPPDVAAFHDVLAPIWHTEPGDGRAQAACEGVGSLRERAAALGDVGVTGAVEALGAECDATGPEVEARLAAVHDAYHAVADQHAPE